MADRSRLHPLRICAVMAALLMPLCAQAGPAVDPKEMRKALRVATATPSTGVADVASLLAELGLREAPTNSGAKPVTGFGAAASGDQSAPVFGGAGGLFTLQAAQKDDPAKPAGFAMTSKPVDVSVGISG